MREIAAFPREEHRNRTRQEACILFSSTYTDVVEELFHAEQLTMADLSIPGGTPGKLQERLVDGAAFDLAVVRAARRRVLPGMGATAGTSTIGFRTDFANSFMLKPMRTMIPVSPRSSFRRRAKWSAL